MFHLSRSNLGMDFFCCRLARKPTHGSEEEIEGEAPGGSTRSTGLTASRSISAHKLAGQTCTLYLKKGGSSEQWE